MKESTEEFCELMDSARKKILDLGEVSIMPDYFVDRFVRVNSIEELYGSIIRKSSEGGGGSIRGIKQSETKGGNAVNTSYALGKFGAKVHLLTIAEGLASLTLESVFRDLPNVSVEIVKGATGYTVAFEFVKEERHVNVMASETGDLARFDGSLIPKAYWKTVARSKIACVLNWGANQKGTELCERVFSFARKHGVKTFMDPADPLEMERNLPELRKKVFDKGLVDVLSLNENEANIFSRVYFNSKLPQDFDRQDVEKVVRNISEVTGGTVDLHTRSLSVTCSGRECIQVVCHKVQQKTITGAGDVWDAAELVGYLGNWSPESRLRFANAAAGLYVSRENVEPPSIREIIDFIRAGG